MADASYSQTSFLGGEWSKAAQGRFDRQDYRAAMNRCYNGMPLEPGAWTRRPGTRWVSATHKSRAGRVMPFAFEQTAPYILEHTDGVLRFFQGTDLATTNDDKTVSSVSSASPAVVTTTAAHGWSTGDFGFFDNLGTSNSVLQRRRLQITVTGSTTFTLVDARTSANIDGSTLDAFPATATFRRVQILATPYVSETWRTLRMVQAERKAVLLQGTVSPRLLEVSTLPTSSTFAQFAISEANFLDGPYLDPVPGSLATPSALNGNITLTLSFQAYDSARSYNLGDYVTSAGASYRSLTQGNVGNTPASSPSNWVAVNGGAAVGTSGFQAGDVGRHVRLFSEPPVWAVGTTYAAKAVVAYNNTYWISPSGGNTGNVPGSNTSWVLFVGQEAAKWTWGKITAISGAGLISQSLSGTTNIGNMTGGGGLAAAFDSTVTKAASASASGSSESHLTPPAYVAGTIYAANFLATYGGTLYKASAPATSAWAVTDAPANGVVRTYSGRYQVVSAQPSAFVSGGYHPQGQVVSYAGSWWVCRLTYPGTLTPGSNPAYWEQGVRPDHIYNQYPSGTGTTLSTHWALGVTPGTNASYWNTYTLGAQLYVGRNYTSSTGGAKAISHVIIYPSSDSFFANNSATQVVWQLRAKSSAPSSATDGTLLGSATAANGASPVQINSSDTTTTWNYVWVTPVASASDAGQQPATVYVSQLQLYTTNVANGSVCTVQIQGDALLYSGEAVRIWRLGVYSTTTGFPTCGTFHKGRLWLGGVVSNRLDASKSGTLFDFTPTAKDGTVADDNAIAMTFNADDANPAFWLRSEATGIVCGTPGGEFQITAPTAGALSPTNRDAERPTKIRCANIEPVKAGLTLAMVQKHRRKLMEYFTDVQSGKFTSPNISRDAAHLMTRGIAELAYQQELVPVVWARMDDGTLTGVTYKRESLLTSQGPAFIAWHHHKLGSGHTVESIATGPSTSGSLETLAMTTKDASGLYNVEFLTDIFEEGADVSEAWHLDFASRPTTMANVTVSTVDYLRLYGLRQLRGLSGVRVYAGGLDLGEHSVSSTGICDIPYGSATHKLFTQAFVASFSPIIPVVCGFAYDSEGQLVRAMTERESGARQGPALGKTRRTHQFAALLQDAQDVSFGTDFDKLKDADFRTGLNVSLADNVLFSGVFTDALQGPNDYDSMIAWRCSGPYPATVCAVQGFLQTQDK